MKKLILILILLASPAFAKDVTLEWDHDGNCTEYQNKMLKGYP